MKIRNLLMPLLAITAVLFSCSHQSVLRDASGRIINQFTPDHLKTGYWIEKDSVSTIMGIVDYYDSDIKLKGDPPKIKSKYGTKWSDRYYYPVTAKGMYNNDRKNGEWIYSIDDTAPVKKAYYSNNTLDSMFLYNLKGKLIFEGRTDWEKDEFVYKGIGGQGKFPLYFLSTNQNWNWMLR